MKDIPINQSKIWRSDITGLRALAVIPVLLFHAFPEYLPGGFYGVDIFFVISGFLISGIIFRGLDSNKFSFLIFYFNRIKRILPNLILVLIFVFCMGTKYMTALELQELSKHILAGSLFFQNFQLIENAGEYFSDSSARQPLLHLWSLAIEEQFYILFPLVAYLLYRFKQYNWIPLFVVVLTICSFFSTTLIKDSAFNFYFPVSRFWEIGFGILTCIVMRKKLFDSQRLSKRVKDILSVICFTAILLCYFILDKSVKHPGVYTLVPVISTCILIFIGDQGVINSKLLSSRLFIFIGLISYSLYLWHWPFLAFLHVCSPESGAIGIIFALSLSFIVSVFVYYFVENPARRLKPSLFFSLLMLSLVACSIPLNYIVQNNKGFPKRDIAKKIYHDLDWSYPNGLNLVQKDGIQFYSTSIQSDIPEILFIGDSHIEQYKSRIEYLSKLYNKPVAFLTLSGCLSWWTEKNPRGEKCEKISNDVQRMLSKKQLRKVVVGQMWGAYQYEHPNDFRRAMNFLEATVQKYDKLRWYIVLDLPWAYGSTFDLKTRVNRFNINEEDSYTINVSKDDIWNTGNLSVKDILKTRVTFIDGLSEFCPNLKCDLYNYKDWNHLRDSYSKEHAVWIDAVFVD